MTIEQEKAIDLINTNEEKGYVILTISDHLEWDEVGEKLLVLKNKINPYLAFIESDKILENHPEAKYKTIVIRLVSLEAPKEEGNKFIKIATLIIEEAGFKFESVVYDEKQLTSHSFEINPRKPGFRYELLSENMDVIRPQVIK